MNRVAALLLIFLLIMSTTVCRKKSLPQIAEPGEQTAGTPSEPAPGEALQTTETATGELDALSRQLKPVFFDFDRSEIRDDQASVLKENARILRQHAGVNVIVEGHCDERGTDEYNLALGERRANVVKDYMIDLGIEGARIQTISYGESKPFDEGQGERSWQQNRRAQSVVMKPQ